MRTALSQFLAACGAGQTGRQPVARIATGSLPDDKYGRFPAGENGAVSAFDADGDPAHDCGGAGGAPCAGHGPGWPRHARRGRHPRRHRRGLIGVLLSIIVLVLFIIGIFAVYNQITASATAANTAIFIRQLAPQVTQFYRGNYSGINARAVIGAGFVPANWQRDGSNIEDPEGRNVLIAAASGNARFTITFASGVAEETCKAVLGALKTDRTFVSVRINALLRNRGAVDTPQEIQTACQAADPTTFVLTFR